ncbi:class F sortase [Jatrophihabitans sp. DSM 45814]
MADPAAGREDQQPTSRWPGWVGWVICAVVTVALLATGVGLIADGARTHRAHAAPLPTRTFRVDPAAITPLPASAAAALDDALPVDGCASLSTHSPAGVTSRILVPAVCIDAPIVRTTVADRQLIIPGDVHQVGLWDQGAPLVSTTGTTLLAGHVDFVGQGNGALHVLSVVRAGDVIYLSGSATSHTRWRVIALETAEKAALPAAVFAGPSGPRRLVVVTCGGPIEHLADGTSTYRDNVIVTAVPG